MTSGDNVFQFTDFRSFLWAYYEDTKRLNPSWSLGAWARKLGLKGTASLSMVLNGQRLPGPKMTSSLIKDLGFSNVKEKQYFTDLIRLQRIKNDPALKSLLVEKLNRDNPKNFKLLTAEQFRLISQWHHYALREMVRLKEFREDPHWIRKELNFKVSSSEIKKAIDRLIQFKLLERDSSGKLRATKEIVETAVDVEDEGLKRFHEDMIENAKLAVRKVSVKDREIVGGTITVKDESIPIFKERIRSFMREMMEGLAVEQGDATYQFNVQFFPLSKIKKGRQ